MIRLRSVFKPRIPQNPGGGVYPTPFPLPRSLRGRCVVDSRPLISDFGEIRPICKIYYIMQYEMAFFIGKNGPRGATVSETFLLALEIMLKTAPSAPTSFLRAPKRPPRGLQEGPKRAPGGPKRLPRGRQAAPRGAQDPFRRGSSGF